MRNQRFVLARLLAAGVFMSSPCIAKAQNLAQNIAEPLYSQVIDVAGKHQPETHWHKLTTKGGCFVYFHTRAIKLHDPKYPLESIHWTGDCRPGQLGTGTGFLAIEFRGGMPDKFHGTLQNGFLHGEIRTPTMTSKSLNEMSVNQWNMGCRTTRNDHFNQQCLKTQRFVQQAQGKPVVVLIENGEPARVVPWPPASAPSSSPPPVAQAQPRPTSGPPAAATAPTAAASSRTPPAADRPDPNRQRKVHNPAADARPCVQAKQVDAKRGGVRPTWNFTNNCNSTIELFWCVVKAGGCSGGGTWTVRAGGTWPVFDEGNLKWGACRGRNGGGMDSGMNGERFTCHLLKW